MVSSFAFKFYVANLTNFSATYGAIGGVVVLLLWFYVSGLAILIGAELNGVIERARSAAPRQAPSAARSPSEERAESGESSGSSRRNIWRTAR